MRTLKQAVDKTAALSAQDNKKLLLTIKTLKDKILERDRHLQMYMAKRKMDNQTDDSLPTMSSSTATKDLVLEHCRRTEEILQSSDREARVTTELKLLQQIDSILAKACELQDHTKRFQDKHGNTWKEYNLGHRAPTNTWANQLSCECTRLLDANHILSQQIAQVITEFIRENCNKWIKKKLFFRLQPK